MQLTTIGKVKNIAISPDGRYVAYAVDGEGDLGGGRSGETLWVRQVAGSDVRVAAPADVGYDALTFSHDGDFLYAVRWEGKDSNFKYLYKIPVLGGTAKRLITDVDSKVTLSPDGTRFAFVRNSSAASDSALVIANEDGSGEKKLAVHKDPNGFGFVAWSPNGKTIAASVHNSEPGRKYMSLIEIPAKGGLEQPLSSKQWAWLGPLSWVSDCRGLIATAEEQAGGNWQIEYISYASGEVRKITHDLNDYYGLSLTADCRILATVQSKTSYDVWVASFAEADRAKPITSGGVSGGAMWSPDGKIVYGNLGGQDAKIMVMEPDGTNAKPLMVSEGQTMGAPHVSPDGRHIVFNSYRTGNPHLWRIDLDGNNPVQLTNSPWDNRDAPDFSPDGKWVFYSKVGPERGIWKVPIEGGDPVRLVPSTYWAESPAASPDGKMLAYSYRDTSAKPVMGVAIMSVEGGSPQKHFDIPHGQVQWSPDSRSLLYVKSEAGVSNLWSQPISGGAPKQSTHFNSELIWGFGLSRDGKQLIMDRGTANDDVVLIRDVK